MKIQFLLILKKIRSELFSFVAIIAFLGHPFASTELLASDHRPKQEITLIEAIHRIGEQYNVLFNYDREIISGIKVNYLADTQNVDEAISAVLENTNLRYRMFNHRYVVIYQNDKEGIESLKEMIQHFQTIVFEEDEIPSKPVRQEPVKRLASHSAFPKLITKKISFTVQGTITDQDGEPLIGVNIQVKNSSKGTSTDFDGNFSLTDIDENAVLVISYVGYQTQEVTVAGKSNLEIVMVSDSKLLDEVVITALGIQREEKSLGYAVQNISGDDLQTVKGIDITTSLTGKISGLVIKNSTEFYGSSGIEMRGESPLLVINGVPYANLSLKDIPADEIEDITMLKGATSAALYGSRGSAGAIMITTKGGREKGFSIDVNTNTMFRAGWISIPKAQTSYGHGLNGEIAEDYVWGPKLDIGNTAIQWDPISKEFKDMPLVSSGKNNFKNFIEPGLITNNNINITQTGENGYFRTGINYMYNKGQFPNQHLNKINYTLSGELKMGDKMSIESQLGYMRSKAPQVWGQGYGTQGYIYQILMWSGPDYDLRDYKDYWVVPHEEQNWLYRAWYDNPYMIAYEKLYGIEENKLNASVTMNYNFMENLKLVFRNGYDMYKDEQTARNPAGIYSNRGPDFFGWGGKGMFGMRQLWGNSINSDLMLNYDETIGKMEVDILGGGSLYYYQDRTQGTKTANGLAVPGWYSLANGIPSEAPGVNSIDITQNTYSRQINSVYGKVSLGWNHWFYLDVTGRNDWSSTQPKEERSYFYPSATTSVVLSEIMNMPSWLSMWKVRGSWTIAKSPLGVYASNRPYSMSNSWGLISASSPSNLMGDQLLPSESRTWEVGTGAYLFGKRFYVDVAYFDKLYYNRQISQSIAPSSGFSSTLINTDETYARRGLEITLSGDVIRSGDFTWNSMINYSFQHRYFVELDDVYSQQDQWTQSGKRLDYYAQTEKVLRDPDGNMIHRADGLVWLDNYRRLYGYSDPNFSFGFINTIKYKNWTLSATVDGRIGGYMDNYTAGKMYDTGSAPETDTPERYDEVVNGAKYIGEGVKVIEGSVKYDTEGNILEDTRVYAKNDIPVSYQEYIRLLENSWEGRIRNQSFFKVRELALVYTLPPELTKSIAMSNVSIAVTGQNLYLWTKEFKYEDPDVGYTDLNAPSQRMIGINLKIGF